MFEDAGKKIKQHQKKYTDQYNSRNKTRKSKYKVGDRVQRMMTTNQNRKGGKLDHTWTPHDSFYTVRKLIEKKQRVFLHNPRTKQNLIKSYPIAHIRPFHGK